MDVLGVYIMVLVLLVFFTGGITAIDRELEALRGELSKLKSEIGGLKESKRLEGLEARIMKMYEEGYTPRSIAETLHLPLSLVVKVLSGNVEGENLDHPSSNPAYEVEV